MSNTNETDNHAELARRVDKTEEEIAKVIGAVGEQGKQIASLTTAIETQTKQLGNLFHRTEREKTPWAIILMGVSIMIVLSGLALTPIYQGITELKSNDILSNAHRRSDAYDMGTTEANLTWLIKLEEREYHLTHDHIKN